MLTSYVCISGWREEYGDPFKSSLLWCFKIHFKIDHSLYFAFCRIRSVRKARLTEAQLPFPPVGRQCGLGCLLGLCRFMYNWSSSLSCCLCFLRFCLPIQYFPHMSPGQVNTFSIVSSFELPVWRDRDNPKWERWELWQWVPANPDCLLKTQANRGHCLWNGWRSWCLEKHFYSLTKIERVFGCGELQVEHDKVYHFQRMLFRLLKTSV